MKSDAGPRSAERMQTVIELLRQTHTATHGLVTKGGGDGVAMSYRMCFPALLASIRVGINNDADWNRITVLDLNTRGRSKERFERANLAMRLLDERFAERFFARSIQMLPTILLNYKVFFEELATRNGYKFALQHAPLLAGYKTLFMDRPVTADDAKGECDFLGPAPGANSELTDHEECLNRLLTHRIQVVSENATISISGFSTIGEIISSDTLVGAVDPRVLETYGLKVKDGFLYVAYSHKALQEIFRQSRWQENWNGSLARITGTEIRQQVKIGGRNIRAIKIPLDRCELETSPT